jgi:hypothetical protein
MIISKLQGGLANQLFQWACGKCLSEEYNTPLYLDISSYSSQLGMTKREFSLNKFPNLKYQTLPSDRNISNFSEELEKKRIEIITDNFIFKKLKYNNDSHIYLNGYWQSEKYFKDIQYDIRRNLQPKNEKLKDFLPLHKNNISLHIRRTDYITSKEYHPVLPLDYYEHALNIIGEYDNIFVFSDDIDWCKTNLEFEKMTFIEGFDDVEDLWLMSMCNHNIIANSSFSWWGAWLNTNKDKKVITPLNWFGDHVNLNTSDIIPENWIKI